MHDIQLFSKQHLLITSKFEQIYAQMGVGAGKTFAVAVDIILMLQKYPSIDILLVAGTSDQLNGSTVRELVALLDNYGIKHNWRKNTNDFFIYYGEHKSKVWLRTSEAPGTIRGLTVGIAYGDEAAHWKNLEETYINCLSRIRGYGPRQFKLISSGKGYNYLYDIFHPHGLYHDSTKRQLIVGKTLDNTAPLYDDEGNFVETVGQKIDRNMQSTLSPRKYAEECHGEFISHQDGKVHYAFSREDSVMDIPKPEANDQIFCGMDFNVDYMSAVLGYIRNGNLYIFDEIFLQHKDANTISMAKTITSLYGDEPIIIPDASARNRSSNSGKTNLQILKDHGLSYQAGRKNPLVKDRYEKVNYMFHNKRIFIDPKCRKLLFDLDKLSYIEGTDKVNKSNALLSHLSDAMGYLVYRKLKIFMGEQPKTTTKFI